MGNDNLIIRRYLQGKQFTINWTPFPMLTASIGQAMARAFFLKLSWQAEPFAFLCCCLNTEARRITAFETAHSAQYSQFQKSRTAGMLILVDMS
jgi:hypothetical protein